MAEKKSERVKIYLIIGLSFVLIVAVYFRFIRKQTTQPPPPALYGDSIARLAVPQVQLPSGQGEKPSKRGHYGLGRSISRDIFEPVKAPPQRETQPRCQEPARPTMSLKLKGTVIGGENPVAVINDKFVYTGDRIGDYEVITIGEDEVVLKSDTHNMVLRILKIAEI